MSNLDFLIYGIILCYCLMMLIVVAFIKGGSKPYVTSVINKPHLESFNFTYQNDELDEFQIEVSVRAWEDNPQSNSYEKWVFFVDEDGHIFNDQPGKYEHLVTEEDWHRICKIINSMQTSRMVYFLT